MQGMKNNVRMQIHQDNMHQQLQFLTIMMWALMGNQGARMRMASIIPPVIPPLGINLEHEASQRHEGIRAERGVGNV